VRRAGAARVEVHHGIDARKRYAFVLDAAAVHFGFDDRVHPRAAQSALAAKRAAAILLEQAQVFGFEREAQVERLANDAVRGKIGAA
jgi:hypothetical protein